MCPRANAVCRACLGGDGSSRSRGRTARRRRQASWARRRADRRQRQRRRAVDSRFHPFWAKAEQLGVLIFIHPQGTPELEASGRLKGNGVLTNVIGNPLETTIALSHLIFEGTLDRYPEAKICGAHAGG